MEKRKMRDEDMTEYNKIIWSTKTTENNCVVWIPEVAGIKSIGQENSKQT